MNCEIIKDLIPLYIDDCCSEDSQKAVKEHISNCAACRKLLEEMEAPSEVVTIPQAPSVFRKLNDWKASVLQSALLFLSFALITVGVALEAQTPMGLANGFWACNLVIPATGFMLSLANWYFISIYRNAKRFSNRSLLTTFVIIVAGYVWAGFHYKLNPGALFFEKTFTECLETLHGLMLRNGIGILLTVVLCMLSKALSVQYAKMLGKE